MHIQGKAYNLINTMMDHLISLISNIVGGFGNLLPNEVVDITQMWNEVIDS